MRSRGEGAQMSPGATRKHSDHIATDGKQEFDTTSATEYGEVSGNRPKFVHKKIGLSKWRYGVQNTAARGLPGNIANLRRKI